MKIKHCFPVIALSFCINSAFAVELKSDLRSATITMHDSDQVLSVKVCSLIDNEVTHICVQGAVRKEYAKSAIQKEISNIQDFLNDEGRVEKFRKEAEIDLYFRGYSVFDFRPLIKQRYTMNRVEDIDLILSEQLPYELKRLAKKEMKIDELFKNLLRFSKSSKTIDVENYMINEHIDQYYDLLDLELK